MTKEVKKVHFLGIGGSGASAAAALAKSAGFEISGCDKQPNNEFTSQFNNSQLLKGHSASHIGSGDVDLLAVTPAIFSLDPDNPELIEAKKLGIPVLTWQQFVGEYLAKEKFVIAICGTHGKTTTTAMIAQILEDANLDPTVLLGAIHPKWKTNYRHPGLDPGSINIDSGSVAGMTKNGYFVVEADEFNDNFLSYKPNITIVTNIEMDHPEYFKDFESYKESFKKFLLQTGETVVANLSDPGVSDVLKVVMKTPRQKYHDRNKNVQYLDYSKNHIDLDLKIPGEHNILNAKAALQIGLLLGIEPEVIRRSLNNYTGVGRRFEYLGKFHQALVYSDFGHHPTEIEKTMIAAREKFPDNKIWLFYQPHMFSRTKALFDDFVKVFRGLPVDGVVILDIYPSREIDSGLVSSEQLIKAINKPNFHYAKEIKKEEFEMYSKPGDILFFMGAGDVDKLARELVS